MKKILRIALPVFLVLLPLLLSAAVIFLVPSQYSDTFFGGLNEKYDRLKSVDQPKIVIVGGSSVAFGIDSEMLAEETGYEVVNFGLYADLGTKIMLDLSEAHINEGDIVILAPELDAQTLSLYFSGESAWKALDDEPSMLFRLKSENYGDLWGGLWGYMKNKVGYLFDGAPDPEGVYNAGNFNEYGDISPDLFPRKENLMTFGYDTNLTLTLDGSVYDGAFLEYLNGYINKAQKKGATVYYSFCPMNADAIDTSAAKTELGDSATKEEQFDYLSAQFLSFVKEHIDCETIGTPADNIIDSLYFYDSNFHLNDSGVSLHTAQLTFDLLSALGKTPQENLTARELAQPGILFRDDVFVYRRSQDGTSYIICDVVTNASYAKSFYIPGFVENESGKTPISGIDEHAFDLCHSVVTVVFASDSQLVSLSEICFTAMKDLSSVYFYSDHSIPFIPYQKGNFTFSCYLKDELVSDAINEYGYPMERTDSYFLTETDLKPIIDADMATLLAQQQTVAVGEDEFFLYRQLPGKSFMITGLTEAGMDASYLVIPDVFNYNEEDFSVTQINSGAFSGTEKLTSVIVPEGSHLNNFANNTFADSSVKTLYLYVPVSNFSVVSARMVSRTKDGFTISVYGNENLANYKNDYSWDVFGRTEYNMYRENTVSEEALLAQLSEGTGTDTEAELDPMWKASLWLLVFLGACALAFVLVWFFYDRRHPVVEAEKAEKNIQTEKAPDGT